ncbi:MAG: hypothetical protein QM723_38215 [Myxococcaceae bacterium]
MERERTGGPAEELDSREREGGARVAKLPQLVDALTGADSDDRVRIAGELNELLIAMRAPGHEGAESAVVQAALNAKKLHGVVDKRGRSCRREAVETLLATGFPHALEVAPEDLAFARSFDAKEAQAPAHERAERGPPNEWKQQMRARRNAAAIIASTGSALAVVGQLIHLAKHSDPGLARFGSIALALVTAAVTFAFARRETDTQDQGSFGTAIAITTLLQLLCVFGSGWEGSPALVGGGAALIAIFMGEYDEPRYPGIGPRY